MWTKEESETAQKLWFSGLSALQVAAEMTRIYHRIFTKNACLGHINRLASKGLIERRADYVPQKRQFRTGEGGESRWRKIPRKPIVLADVSPERQRTKQSSTKKSTIGNVVTFSHSITTDDSRQIGVRIELATGCLFAIEETQQGVHLFCNASKKRGSSYCPQHHRVCYVPVPARVIRPNFQMPK